MRMNRMAALTLSAGMITMAACSDSPTAPTVLPRTGSGPSLAVNDAVGDEVTPTPAVGRLTVCKSSGSNVAGHFTITGAPVNSGTGQSFAGDLVVEPGHCRIAAFGNNVSGKAWRVTVTETSPGFVAPLKEREILDENESAPPAAVVLPEVNATPGTAYDINNIHGYTLTYTNIVELGNEGCTPGYWKQTQHFGNWPVALNTTFAMAGMNFGYTGTLLSGLGANGGGVNALARHAAAAYLNSLSGDVDFAYTTAQVIAIANGTGIYSSLTIEQRKDLLAAANEGVGGCPLARAELSS